jgi:hypothetical protein
MRCKAGNRGTYPWLAAVVLMAAANISVMLLLDIADENDWHHTAGVELIGC